MEQETQLMRNQICRLEAAIFASILSVEKRSLFPWQPHQQERESRKEHGACANVLSTKFTSPHSS
jgi:hypothetical protein